MKEWLSPNEAADKLGISVRALYYRMKKGQLETKMEDGNRLILIDASEVSRNVSGNLQEDVPETDVMLLELLQEKDVRLQEKETRIEQLEKQLEKQAEDFKQQVERQETRIDRLEQLLLLEQKNVATLSEQNQLLLEDNRNKPSWWQRLLGLNGMNKEGAPAGEKIVD